MLSVDRLQVPYEVRYEVRYEVPYEVRYEVRYEGERAARAARAARVHTKVDDEGLAQARPSWWGQRRQATSPPSLTRHVKALLTATRAPAACTVGGSRL